MTHTVMNCREWDPKRFHSNGCIGPKEDGVRGFYYPGESLLWSRDEKPIRGMGHIVDELRIRTTYPADMELVIPGLEFNKLSGLIRNHDATPEARGRIIDIPLPNLSLRERLQLRPTDGEFVTRIPHFKCPSTAYADRCYEKWKGVEGFVWKSLDLNYTNSRADWMRKVPVKNEDCEITGVYEGRGKFEYMLGGFTIDFNGIPCKVGTLKGITMEKRVEIWNNAGDYIGLTCEVQYKNLQPSGKPRQPRFKGFRYDK